jgi:RNA polymerase sigma-70 factor (ECF subfamily)
MNAADDFARMINAEVDRLEPYAVKLTRHRQDAEDLMQIVLIEAFRIRERFDPQRSPAALLTTIMQRKSMNAYAHKQRRPIIANVEAFYPDAWGEIAEINTTPSAEEDFLAADIDSKIIEALDSIPPNQARAFRLRHFSELANPEIAQIMGVQTGTVSTWLQRARKRLVVLLQDEVSE